MNAHAKKKIRENENIEFFVDFYFWYTAICFDCSNDVVSFFFQKNRNPTKKIETEKKRYFFQVEMRLNIKDLL